MNAQLDMCPETVVPKVDENRRYTTRAFMHFIKRVSGLGASSWHLDPAADLESHHAPRWFSAPGDTESELGLGWAGTDGLNHSWLPAVWPPPAPPNESDLDALLRKITPWCIFINPPFDNIGPWLAKVWATIEQARGLAIEVRIAFVMPGNRTEQGLWQDHVEPFLEGHEEAGRLGYQLVAHSPRTRQFYGHPGNPEPKSGQAEWPSVVLVWRRA